jgi:hypothetical protein
VIEAAADRQMAFLRRYQAGEHREQATRLLNELARARICLLKPANKVKYDASLKQALEKIEVKSADESAESRKGDSAQLSMRSQYAISNHCLCIPGGWAEWKITGIRLESPDSPGEPATVLAADSKTDSIWRINGVEKLQSPDPALLESTKKKLKSEYAVRYINAKKPPQKIRLAEAFFARGKKPDEDPASCFVLLSEAARLAEEGGNFDLAWAVFSVLDDRFEVDTIAMKAVAIDSVQTSFKTFEEGHQALVLLTELAKMAVNKGEYENGMTAMQIAEQIVRKASYADFRESVALEKKRVLVMSMSFDIYQRARKSLMRNRADPPPGIQSQREVHTSVLGINGR